MLDDVAVLARRQSDVVRAALYGLTGRLDGVKCLMDVLAQGETYGRLTSKQLVPVRSAASLTSELVAQLRTLLQCLRFRADESAQAQPGLGLRRVLRRAVEDVAGLASGKGVTVGVTCPPDLSATVGEERLQCVVRDLLQNAVAFTPEGGQVQLTASSAEAERDMPQHIRADLHEACSYVLVSVKDTGIGVAAEDQERIFRPFERAGSFTGEAGAGLGLPLARELVEAGGGRIWVESELGKGSTFSFVIPKDGPPEAEEES